MKQHLGSSTGFSLWGLVGVVILTAALLLGGQGRMLNMVSADQHSQKDNPSDSSQTGSELVFDQPNDISVSPGESRDFHFSIESSTFVGLAFTEDPDAHCVESSFQIDGLESWEILDTMPPGIGEVRSDWSPTSMWQVFLPAGNHIVTVNHMEWQEDECHGVLFLYKLGVPDSKNVDEVSMDTTCHRIIEAGNVNVHLFHITDAPRAVAIYAIPQPGARLLPVMRLYRPDGLLMATALYDPLTQDTRLSGMMLPSNGEYMLTVQDWNHANGGEYRLAIAYAKPLVTEVGDARLEYLPHYGPQRWTLIVDPSDLTYGSVNCIAYSLVEGRPVPQIVESILRSSTDFQCRAEVASQPGIFDMNVVNNPWQSRASYESGGAYIFGCADVGQHKMIGIGGTFKFKGDYFTRFLPAIAGSSASFSLQTETHRSMQLQLWYRSKLIAHAEGRKPSFDVEFSEDGVYILVGKGAPGTRPEIVNQSVSIEWIELPNIEQVELPPEVEPTPTTPPTAAATRKAQIGPAVEIGVTPEATKAIKAESTPKSEPSRSPMVTGPVAATQPAITGEVPEGDTKRGPGVALMQGGVAVLCLGVLCIGLVGVLVVMLRRRMR